MDSKYLWIFQSNILKILMMKLILHITYCYLIHKFQKFVVFTDGSSANIKFSKTHLSKIVELGGFLFGPSDIFGSPIKEMI